MILKNHELTSFGQISKSRSKRYDVLDCLGSGVCGDVHKLRHCSTAADMAMKLVDLQPQNGYNGSKEIEILQLMHDHVNVVRRFDIFLTDDQKRAAIIMEYCEADLTGYLEKTADGQVNGCLDIALQVTNGVTFLHTHKPPIIHGDLKPQHILIKENPQTLKVFAKLTGFGSSDFSKSELLKKNPYQRSTDVKAPDAAEISGKGQNLFDQQKNEQQVQKFEGSTAAGKNISPYMAPEMFETMAAKRSADADVCSLGLVLFYTFCFNTNEYSKLSSCIIRYYFNVGRINVRQDSSCHDVALSVSQHLLFDWIEKNRLSNATFS